MQLLGIFLANNCIFIHEYRLYCISIRMMNHLRIRVKAMLAESGLRG